MQLAITISRLASEHKQAISGASLNNLLCSVQPKRLTWLSRFLTQAFYIA